MRDSQVGNPVDKARQRYQVQFYQYYARDPETGLWLHLSGCGWTGKLEYAWCGYPHQFECLKARAQEPHFAELCKLELIRVKHARENGMSLANNKENLEDFFNGK